MNTIPSLVAQMDQPMKTFSSPLTTLTESLILLLQLDRLIYVERNKIKMVK